MCPFMFDRLFKFRFVSVQCDDKTKHKRLSLGAYAVEHKDEMEEMINSVSPHFFIVCMHMHTEIVLES